MGLLLHSQKIKKGARHYDSARAAKHVTLVGHGLRKYSIIRTTVHDVLDQWLEQDRFLIEPRLPATYAIAASAG